MAIGIGSSKGFGALLGLAQRTGEARKIAKDTAIAREEQARRESIAAQERRAEANRQFQEQQVEQARLNRIADARDQYLKQITLDERKRTLDWKKELDKQELDYQWDIKTHDAYKKADAEYQVGRDQAKKIQAEQKLARQKAELGANRQVLMDKYNNKSIDAQSFVVGMKALDWQEAGFSSAQALMQVQRDYEIYDDVDAAKIMQQIHTTDVLEANTPMEPTALDVVGTATQQILGVNFQDVVRNTVTEQPDRIRVRDKKSGQTGTIPANEFNASLYERL